MQSEHINIESIIKERRLAVEETIKPIDAKELKELQESLFTDPLHPWLESFRRFAEENSGNLFYHASTKDHVQVIYCRKKEKGIWFLPGVGIGILQPKALEILRDVVDSRK